MQPPIFLVQANDDTLHGYNREDLLLIDLAGSRHDPPKRIFRLSQTSLDISYDPIDAPEIRPNPELPALPQNQPIALLEA